jgi:exopolysaccharide biosynthesis operon protein EpsL
MNWAPAFAGVTLFLLSSPALALWGDRIEVFAGQNATYDSNVFRISEGRDPQSTIGAPSFADRSYVTMVGATASIPVSLQRFEASAVFNHTRYDRFSDLNFNGHNARLAWLYAVEDVLTGEVSATQTKGLSTFSNIQGRVPDFVTSRNFLANAAWMVTPRWRLHGVLTASEQEHTAPQRLVQDLERASTEAGISYVTPAANRVGVAVRAERGRLPSETVFAGIPFDNSYDQVGTGVIGRYQVTGLSVLDARVEYIKREYDQLPSRNYSGPTFSAAWTYSPTPKTSFVTTAIRDIGPLEDINTSFVLVTGISVKPKWNATEKITVQGNVEYSEWDYRGDPLIGTSWTNKVRTIGVGVAWRPLRRVLLQAAVSREKRTSTLPFNDYVVDLVTIEGRIGF